MVSRVDAYLRTRRGLGFELRTEGGELLRFARFADGSRHHGAVTTDIATRWALQAATATQMYRARRLEIVRCFARHQAAFDTATEIPPPGILGPARRRVPPYIFTSAEITRLMAAARRLRPARGLRGATYASLIGLIACTGLRISEALRLRRKDADLESGVLTILHTKFRKSRLVPIDGSVQAELRRYLARRDTLVSHASGLTLFVGEKGGRLPYSTVRTACRKLIDKVVRPSASRSRRPRIHDLRHTFACRSLLRGYRDGVDIDRRIAALSTYLGHAKVSDTYWYLTRVPELMAISASLFERYGRDAGDHDPRE